MYFIQGILLPPWIMAIALLSTSECEVCSVTVARTWMNLGISIHDILLFIRVSTSRAKPRVDASKMINESPFQLLRAV